MLEEGSSIGVELHFGLLEQTVVNTLVEEDTSKEELIYSNSNYYLPKSKSTVHGEDEDFITVGSSLEEKFFGGSDFTLKR